MKHIKLFVNYSKFGNITDRKLISNILAKSKFAVKMKYSKMIHFCCWLNSED